MNSELDIYLSAFTHVKRANTRYGLAPHKPILLLTLVELIEKGIVINNCFEVNVDLVGLFQENWRLLVRTSNQPHFTQPFYYLQSDKAAGQGFWGVYPNPGFQINAHIKSVKILSEVVAYGAFDDKLIGDWSVLERIIPLLFPLILMSWSIIILIVCRN